MEETLSLPEIKIIIETYNKRKRAEQVFLAGLQGIDLEAQVHKQKIKDIQDRVDAQLAGGEDKLESMSLADLGMIVEEIEEEGNA